MAEAGGVMKKTETWQVDVYADGEVILSIGSGHLSGRDDIADYADTVRNCADHLMSFIGPDTAEVSEIYRLTAALSQSNGTVKELYAECEALRGDLEAATLRAERYLEAIGDTLNNRELIDTDNGDAYYFLCGEFIQHLKALAAEKGGD